MNPETIQAVTDVVQSYVDACHQGDVNILKSLFHPEAAMFGYLAGNLLGEGPEPFFDAIANSEAPKDSDCDYQAEIEHVAVFGEIATATLRENNLLGLDFINHFQLLKADGEWLIVAKLFESSPGK